MRAWNSCSSSESTHHQSITIRSVWVDRWSLSNDAPIASEVPCYDFRYRRYPCPWKRRPRLCLPLLLVLLLAYISVECTEAFIPKHSSGGTSNSMIVASSRDSSLNAKRPSGGRFNNNKDGSNRGPSRGFAKNSTFMEASSSSNNNNNFSPSSPTLLEFELQQRISQLEQLVSSQAVELRRLKDQVRDLTSAAETFGRVMDLLRQAGLDPEQLGKKNRSAKKNQEQSSKDDDDLVEAEPSSLTSFRNNDTRTIVTESLEDDTEIFGKAPSSVTEAADIAGASILAAILAGKKRLLVDVRDAELSTNSETLVQFIELAILPAAAAYEGLQSKRNRLKVVFPTVSQLLEYRRKMTLSAPEVVALSTLGFDPVEQKDNLVVIVAPSPVNTEGLAAMNELFHPTDGIRKPIDQPVVILNHHMVPISGPAASFEVAYHLRLLSVQYMSGDGIPENLQQRLDDMLDSAEQSSDVRDAAVEAAMKHAQSGGLHHGVTRGMVIRAYPNPWHVFVDTSPDTNADFEVAATFDKEPSPEEVHRAIVECLEGSEEEDEIVAQQMQHALEHGQLDRVTEMLGSMGMDVFIADDDDDDGEGDDSDIDDDVWNSYNEDSV